MKIFLTTNSTDRRLDPPQLSQVQVNFGPYLQNCELGDRLISKRIPAGSFDLANAVRPALDQKPDVVVCLMGEKWTSMPCNLKAFRCPKVLVLEDIGRADASYVRILNYVASQSFDRVVVSQGRHHVDLLRAAGVKNVHWFPGLTFPHSDESVRRLAGVERQLQVGIADSFEEIPMQGLGTIGDLLAKQTPLVCKETGEGDALEIFGSSLLALPLAGDGDLHGRLWEALAAGAATILGPFPIESGISDILAAGREYFHARSAGELVERVHHYLAHPKEAAKIGEAGAAWFKEHLNERRRQQAFEQLVMDGLDQPEFSSIGKKTLRVGFGGNGRLLLGALGAFDHLRQLSFNKQFPRVILDETVPKDFISIVKLLPQVRLASADGADVQSSDFVAMSYENAAKRKVFSAAGIWCWNAVGPDLERVRNLMGQAGYSVEQSASGLFRRDFSNSQAGVLTSTSDARLLLNVGNNAAAFEVARKTIEDRPGEVDGYLIMAEIAYDAGQAPLYEKMLSKARTLGAAGREVEAMALAGATGSKPLKQAARLMKVAWPLLDQGRWYEVRGIADRASIAAPQWAEACFLRALACSEIARITDDYELWCRQGDALKSYRLAVEQDPRSAKYLKALAFEFRRTGLYPEAINAFRECVKLEPGNPVGWFGLGESYFVSGDFDEAAIAFKQGSEVAPNDNVMLLWLGYAYKRQGLLLEALALHQQAFGGSGQIAPVSATGRRRVAFIVQHGPSWTCTESVYAAFKADPVWDVMIIGLPYTHPFYTGYHNDANAVFSFLDRNGIEYQHWQKFNLEPGFADVVFLQNPYDCTRPQGWHLSDLIKLVPRIAYVPYGLEIGGGDRNNNLVMNETVQRHGWLVCARSERQRDAYSRYCRSGNRHVVVTGHSKIDSFRDLKSVRTPELDKFAAGRKVIGWNSHFDVRLNGTEFGDGFSTFLRWRNFLPEEFSRRQDLAFVMRPHPLFFSVIEERGIMTRSDIERFLMRCKEAGNIWIDREPTYQALFAKADAMMSDASSFVLEFCGTGKPLLFLKNPEGPGLNEDGEFVQNYLHTAQTEAEIRSFFDLVASGKDPLGPARREAYSRYMYQPPEGVGCVVKRVVEERLEAELVRAPLDAVVSA